MPEAIPSAWVRHFEDGVAVFDPVAWRTHVLSAEGHELLLSLIGLARDCGADASRVLAAVCDDPVLTAAGPHLEVWAQLACHLLTAPPNA